MVALLALGPWAAPTAPAAASESSLHAVWPGEITLTGQAPSFASVQPRPSASAAVAPVAAAPARGRTPASRGRGLATGCDIHGATVRSSGSARRREVALSFDDGPWSDTPQFLGVLERERVPATFFMIGRQVPGHEDVLRRMLRDGDAIGNHTFDHADLRRLSAAGVRHELSATNDAIHHAVGYRPCLFRPPYGSYDRTVVRLAVGRHMTTVIWDVDPRDWSRPGTGTIEQRVRAQTRSGSIVLMHDGGGPREQTLAALPHIIHSLRGRGMRLVTVPDLLGFRVRYRSR